MTATIVIVANELIPVEALNAVIANHRTHSIQPRVVVTRVGGYTGDLIADVVVDAPGPEINLGKYRNLGVQQCPADWYLFADADTYFTKDLGQFLQLGHRAMRGGWRIDVPTIDATPTGNEYLCMAAPMFLTHKLFYDIGGYHELYTNYGFEDVDMYHKLLDAGIADTAVNTGAYHITSVHRLLGGEYWDRSGIKSPHLEERLISPITMRIQADQVVLRQRYRR